MAHDGMFSGGLFDVFTGASWERLDSAAQAYLRRRDFRSCENALLGCAARSMIGTGIAYNVVPSFLVKHDQKGRGGT